MIPECIMSWTGWTVIETGLTALGAVSLVLATIRFVHDSRQLRWRNNVSIQDHEHDFVVEYLVNNPLYSKIWTENPTKYMTTIVFRPVDSIIPKLKVIELDDDGGEKNVIEVYKNLSPSDIVCFRLERAECVPRFKLRWYSDFGEYGEHYFDDNMRNGINSVNGIVYNATPLSTLRRILNLR